MSKKIEIRHPNSPAEAASMNTDQLRKNFLIEKVFEEITRNVVQETVNRNNDLPPTEAIKITTMAGCSAVKGK